MFVSFVVVKRHPLSRDLSGGRVRAGRNEPDIDAVVRRIEQDTGSRVVDVREATEGPRGALALTLRGHLPTPRSSGPRGPVEGAVHVTIHQGRDTFGPRGARPVRVTSDGSAARDRPWPHGS